MRSPFTGEMALPLGSLTRENSILFQASEAEPAEQEILGALEALPAGAILVVEFAGVRVSSEAARQLLARALRRLRSGELQDRFLILAGLGSSRYNVEVMLQGEDLVAVERGGEPPGTHLIGRVESALATTFTTLASRSLATASEIRDELGLNSTQAATNRLSALVKAALARRVTEQPLEAGGREYVYAAVQ